MAGPRSVPVDLCLGGMEKSCVVLKEVDTLLNLRVFFFLLTFLFVCLFVYGRLFVFQDRLSLCNPGLPGPGWPQTLRFACFCLRIKGVRHHSPVLP